MARTTLAIFLAVLVSGCAPLQQHRTDYAMCDSATAAPSAECERHALQHVNTGGAAGADYLLGFVEFDDQGLLFDRRQMQAVVDRLNEEAGRQDLLMVVFMHGWKHSAELGDGNIETFRKVLSSLSEAEHRLGIVNQEPPRQVVGVYFGWRGHSLTVPGLDNLTFWERKNTAHKVGYVGVSEALNRLEKIKLDKDSTVEGGSRTRLVVVGHSFGGAAMYAALAQLLESRLVHTVGPAGMAGDARGFGNLVVLINPAFEALLFAPLSDMSTERGTYFPSQLPVLAVLTSEADDATRIAFPLGRRLSTFFEKERDDNKRWNAVTKTEEKIDEEDANVTAVGHFEPYRTHFLRAAEPSRPLTTAGGSGSAQALYRAFTSWAQDRPGGEINFGGSVLERTDRSAARNPYLVVRVDKALIKDHNDIAEERMVDFIKQLILLSTQTNKSVEKTQAQSRGLRQ